MTKAVAISLTNFTVKTRDACQPEQAVAPSAHTAVQDSNLTGTATVHTSELSDSREKVSMFVPVKQLKRKRDEPICEVAKLMKSVIENNSTKELIDFMREDLDKAREHELRLMQMMMSLGNQQPVTSKFRILCSQWDILVILHMVHMEAFLVIINHTLTIAIHQNFMCNVSIEFCGCV